MRDVTATVEEQSLIASSIMSKKIATGADAIVLDVKFGLGSFLPDFKEARNLASLMLDIGKYYKIPTHAIISDMNEPLGYAVGNSLEVKEAMDVLMGKGEKRLTEVCTALAMEMIRAVRKDLSGTVIENMLKEKVRSGAALDTLKSWLLAQGAKMDIVSNPEKLALSPNRIQIKASQDGFVTAVHARMVGMAARLLGAGRLSQKDKIDHGAGIWLHAKTGTRVQKGDPIATMYTKKSDVEMPTNLLLKAFTIDNQPPSDSSVVREILKNSI